MKKIIALVLVTITCLSLTGCGSLFTEKSTTTYSECISCELEPICEIQLNEIIIDEIVLKEIVVK